VLAEAMRAPAMPPAPQYQQHSISHLLSYCSPIRQPDKKWRG
jgi:hypothetical protein